MGAAVRAALRPPGAEQGRQRLGHCGEQIGQWMALPATRSGAGCRRRGESLAGRPGGWHQHCRRARHPVRVEEMVLPHRPCQVAEDLECLLPVQEWNSFPSGHMMTLTTAMASVLPVCPLLGWVAGPLLGLMAWARMACGHHYPSDVLAGTALGLVVYYLVSALAVGADLV